MSFKDEFDQQKKESSTSGDFFKFKKDGVYKFRIMCEPVKKVSRWGFGICYEGAPYCQKDAMDKSFEDAKAKAKADGKPVKDVRYPSLSIKWMTWAFLYDKDEVAKKFLDSGNFVIFDMSDPIATAMRELMDSEEYGFKEFPMPYDVTITVKDAGKTTAEYTVLPARSNSELTQDQKEEFEKLTPIQTLKERLQAKQREKTEGGGSTGGSIEYPTDDIKPEDIPF